MLDVSLPLVHGPNLSSISGKVKEISKRLALAPKTGKEIEDMTRKLGGLKVEASPLSGIGKGRIESELTLPPPPLGFLEISFDKELKAEHEPNLMVGKLPLADGDIFEAEVISSTLIVAKDALKRTYLTTLDLKVRT